jgi:hypothetical protein
VTEEFADAGPEGFDGSFGSLSQERLQHGTMRKAKHRGVARIAGGFLLNLIAYNLIRIPKLVAA